MPIEVSHDYDHPDSCTSTRTFAIDKTHSEVTFQVRHLVTKVRGRFTDFSGTIQFDEAHPEQSSLSFTINAASIDTGTPDRDAHLRSDDFFAVDTYPAITFVSSRVAKRQRSSWRHRRPHHPGVTKEVTLPVTHLGGARIRGQRAGRFEAEIAIKRKTSGLVWNTALEAGGFLVGDDVKISVSVQAIVQ